MGCDHVIMEAQVRQVSSAACRSRKARWERICSASSTVRRTRVDGASCSGVVVSIGDMQRWCRRAICSWVYVWVPSSYVVDGRGLAEFSG